MVHTFYEMREEDQPDEKIWLDEPVLAEHFEAIRNTRKQAMDPNNEATQTRNESVRVQAMKDAAKAR